MTACPPIEISVAFATTLDTPGHVALAEQLGFARAWLYDAPQQSPDVWMRLALAAQRTHSIGLAPGVLVPTLRHPMVNAAAAPAPGQRRPGRADVRDAGGPGAAATRAAGSRGVVAAAHTGRRYGRPRRRLATPGPVAQRG